KPVPRVPAAPTLAVHDEAPTEAKTRSAFDGDEKRGMPAEVAAAEPPGFAAPPAAAPGAPPPASAARAPGRGGPFVQNQAPVQAQSPARDAVQDQELEKPSPRDGNAAPRFGARPP